MHSVKVPYIYKQGGRILKKVKEENGSLKTLVYNSNKHSNINGLYALLTKALQKEEVLNFIIDNSEILVKEKAADPWLTRILITELLFGKKILRGDAKPVQTVLSYQDKLQAELTKAENNEIVNSGSESLQATLPRYVRVNTLMLSIEDAIKYFKDEGWNLVTYNGVLEYELFKRRVSSLDWDEFMKDFHFNELLLFSSTTSFFSHELYLNGSIILQDKASCLSSLLLDPPPDSIVLDMCAAPGMKTTHLAALMKNKGTLYAADRSQSRYEELCKTIEKHGATCVRPLRIDALMLTKESCPGVEYILVDPSCSCSGMLKMAGNYFSDKERLSKLSIIQNKLLVHALTNFPDVKRVVYSTCSTHREENEDVVAWALSAVNTDPCNPVFEVADGILKDQWTSRGCEKYEWGPRCLYSGPDTNLTNGYFTAVINRVDPMPKIKSKRKKQMSASDESSKKKKKKGSLRLTKEETSIREFGGQNDELQN